MHQLGRETVRSSRPAAGWLALLVVAALLLAACGGDDDDASDSTATTAPAEEGAPTTAAAGEGGAGGVAGGASGSAEAASLTGTWEGTYACSQGESDLTLTLVDVNGGAVEGFFAFAPPGGDAEAGGSYRVTGTHADGTLTLAGLDWVDQPAGFEMVGLSAEVSGDAPDQLKGTVDGAGCESFGVKRTSTEPWYGGTWKGGYICAQGRTDVTLELTPTGSNTMDAVFEFYPFEDNPDVPSGSYTLKGTWQDNAITLSAEDWVEQPPGYVMVDISTNPDLAIGPDRIAGSVDDPSCEQFILDRAEA